MRDRARIGFIRPILRSQSSWTSPPLKDGRRPNSTFATTHRQPTPGTVASAEERAGDLPPADFEAVTKDMDEARADDDAGDRAGCEKALNEVDRMLKR